MKKTITINYPKGLPAFKGLFVITKDYLDNVTVSNEEMDYYKKSGYNEYFKLFDDDGILYFSGYLHEDNEDDFDPLDWAMADSGCTDIKYRNKDGKMESL